MTLLLSCRMSPVLETNDAFSLSLSPPLFPSLLECIYFMLTLFIAILHRLFVESKTTVWRFIVLIHLSFDIVKARMVFFVV